MKKVFTGSVNTSFEWKQYLQEMLSLDGIACKYYVWFRCSSMDRKIN